MESQINTFQHKQSSTSYIHVEPVGKNAKIALQAQKRSQPWCTPVDLLGLGAPQLILEVSFRSTKKAHVGSQCRAGEKQGGSRNKMALAAGRNVPQTSSRPESHEQWLPEASWRVLMVAASLGKTPRRQVLRELSLPLRPKSVSESGSRCSGAQKPIRGVSGKESCLFSDVSVSKGRADSAHSQLTFLLPLTSSEQELLKGIFRVVQVLGRGYSQL